MDVPRSWWMVVSVVLSVTAAPRAAAEDLYLRGAGLAFPHALPDHGQSLEIVGILDVDASAPSFSTFPETHEYTWTVTGPVVYGIQEPAPGIRELDLTFGVLEIREDPAINAVFQPDPPNESVPSSFHDGEAALLGTLTNLRIREFFGITTATGDIHFEGGTELGSLGAQLDWSFGAAVSTFGEELPSGYGSHWNLELSPGEPVSVDASSWAGVKSLYR